MTADRRARAVTADRESGSGTVVVIGLVAVVVALAATLGLVASAHLGRARAQAAADLAALAGAGDLVLPLGVALAGDAGRDTAADTVTACATARETAARNGAELTGCDVGAAGDVQVTVRVGATGGWATAVARAGPAHLREE